MSRCTSLGTCLLLLSLSMPVQGQCLGKKKPTLCELNAPLAGQLIDHTQNHGRDRRMWSPALKKRMDMYVYLPPGFDLCHKYPVIIYLHSDGDDENGIVKSEIPIFDRAMRCGRMPPVIIAVPEGRPTSNGNTFTYHSGFVNSRLGRFSDYLQCDVWNFLCHNYPIRPEREAHAIGGFSLGGGPAFHHAIKFRNRYGMVFGMMPNVNNRWIDCHGNYFGNFHPCCWGWRKSIGPCGAEPMGYWYGFPVPIRRYVFPLYGRGAQAIKRMSQDNPIEMLDRYCVRPGELEMIIAYSGKDEFNIDAQVESFLTRARQRGLHVDVLYDPNAGHTHKKVHAFLPSVMNWLAVRLGPYSPAGAGRPCPACSVQPPLPPSSPPSESPIKIKAPQ